MECSTYGGEQKHIQRLVGKPEERRLLGRQRYRWEDNTETDLAEVEWDSVNSFCFREGPSGRLL